MTSQRPIIRSVVIVGVAVLAVATPALAQDCPELLGQWPDDTPGLASVAEPYAYLSHESNLMVADISNPAALVVVGSLALDFIGGFAVANGHVFVAGDDFIVVDATNPELPHVVGTVDLVGAESIALSGQYAYVLNFYPAGLRVIDVSVPSSPTEVGSVEGLYGAAGIEVVGPYAYVAWYDSFGTPPSGIKVVDVSDPSAPFEAGSVDFSNDMVGGLAVYGGYAYLGTLDGFRVIDVSTPTAPVEVGFVAMPCFMPGETAVHRGLAWVACREGGLRVMDLKNPLAPVEVGSFVPPEMINYVALGSDFAVAAAYQSAFLVLEQCELPVFADGFESGGTSTWSATVP